MPDSFIDLYRLTSKTLKSPKYKIKEQQYSFEETVFLMFAKTLTNLSNHKSNCKDNKITMDDLDVEQRILSPLKDHRNRIVMEYGLIVDTPIYRQKISWKRPRLFKGIIKINNNTINVNTEDNEIEVFVIKDEYRFNINQTGCYLRIPQHNLKGFKGQFNIQTDCKELQVRYMRIDDELLIHFARSTLNMEIESFIDIVCLFRIDILEILKIRIRLFINEECPSSVILNDLSFASKYRLNLDITDLIEYLSDSISICKCDILGYDLYLYLGIFMIHPRKILIDSNRMNVKHNNPIIENAMPKELYMKLSSKILISILDQIKKVSSSNRKDKLKHDQSSITDIFMEIHKMFRYYIKMGIVLNPLYVRSVFECFADTELKCFIMADIYNRLILDGVSLDRLSGDIDSAMSRIWKLFCRDLNKILKKPVYIKNTTLMSKIEVNNTSFDQRYEAVETIYDMLLQLININKIEDRMKLFDEITEVHSKRIKKSKDVEDLKVIHKSIIKMEKLFGYRDQKIETKLKKRVLENVV